MKDLKSKTDELLAGFRESGYCTVCWTNLHEEPHDAKCPETWMPVPLDLPNRVET